MTGVQTCALPISRETLRRYIERGIYPGSGYASILRMDLTAVLLVDEETLKQLPAIVRWLHNHAPSGCKGGNGRVLAWMEERRGMDLGEAIKALPIAGTLHSVGGPGSGRFTFSPRGRVDDPMEQGDSSWIVDPEMGAR